MKSWFARFRISSALDNGQPLPESLQRQVSRSDELRRFTEETAALGRALREARPEDDPPGSLHGSVMRAVRRAAQPAPAVEPRMGFLAWRLAAGLAAGLALLLAGFWWEGARQPVPMTARTSQALAAPGRALEMGGSMTRTMPPAMVAPLSEELARLNHDLGNTARFLLASLP